MKKLVLVLALLVGGCATIQNPVGPSQLAAVESAYGVALAVAVGYRDACARKLIANTCRPIVVQLQRKARAVQSTVVSARTFVRQNPTLDPTSVIGAARIAVQQLQDFESQYGVR